MPWDEYESTLASFIEEAVAASPTEATRHRLLLLLGELHLRPSLLPDGPMKTLGVYERRASILRAIEDAFPPVPLIGRCVAEAVLDDEKAFREVPIAEVEAARANAERLDWRHIPDAEIEHAFGMNSVYIWLDGRSWPFYVPAFLSYALRHPASDCEHHSRQAFVASPRSAIDSELWTDEQRRAIAMFLAFVDDDERWKRCEWRRRPGGREVTLRERAS